MHAVCIGPVTGQKGDKYMDKCLGLKSTIFRSGMALSRAFEITKEMEIEGVHNEKNTHFKKQVFLPVRPSSQLLIRNAPTGKVAQIGLNEVPRAFRAHK